MTDDGSVAKLVHLLLLSLHRQGAIRGVLHRGANGPTVEFEHADGRVVEEMEIPEVVFPNVVRRLALISNMPYRRADKIGTSQIHLVVRDTEHLGFAIEISGIGPTERVTLRPFTP